MKKLLMILILAGFNFLLSCGDGGDIDPYNNLNSENTGNVSDNTGNADDIDKSADWQIKTLKPIPLYDAYFFMPSTGSLSGLDGLSVEAITPQDTEGQTIKLLTFFTKFGKIYFRTFDPEDIETEIFCMQDDYGIITVLTEAVQPKALDRVEFTSDEFTITTAEYAGLPVSDVLNVALSAGDRYKMIDSFAHLPGVALWYNSPDAREPSRYPGLYRWRIGVSSPTKMKDPGIIWTL